MSRIIADEALKARFKGFSEHLEIRDESGRLLGFFLPGPVHDPEVYAWAKANITEEEVELARQSPEWFTTGEVLEYLRSL